MPEQKTSEKQFFNPQAIPKKGKKKSKSKKTFFKREKETYEANMRTFRFAPRTAQSVFSYLFFGLFLVMCLVVLMTFGRVDTLSRIAASKQVNKETLVENVNHSLKASEQMRYEGMKLADQLFTISHKDEGRKYWEEKIMPYLATGLNAGDLGFSETDTDRIARNVRFIKMDTLNEKDAIYHLYYDVRFTEGEKWQQAQIILPVSYKGQELKLIDYPSFVNLAVTDEKNKSIYQEDRFAPKGKELKEEEKEKIIQFTERFFELYATNDEKLNLIANVQGLTNATIKTVEPKRIVKKNDGNYVVQGMYHFHFDEGSPLMSKFTIEIKPTKESYYVIKMNGEG